MSLPTQAVDGRPQSQNGRSKPADGWAAQSARRRREVSAASKKLLAFGADLIHHGVLRMKSTMTRRDELRSRVISSCGVDGALQGADAYLDVLVPWQDVPAAALADPRQRRQVVGPRLASDGAAFHNAQSLFTARSFVASARGEDVDADVDSLLINFVFLQGLARLQACRRRSLVGLPAFDRCSLVRRSHRPIVLFQWMIQGDDDAS